MAYYPLNSTGMFDTLVGTVADAVATTDILIYNDSEAAISFDLLIAGAVVGGSSVAPNLRPRKLDKKSAVIIENPGAGAVTLTGRTPHNTSVTTGGRIHVLLAGTTDIPLVPTDNIDPDS